MRYPAMLSLWLLAAVSCRQANPDDTGTEIPGGAVTVWTDSTELFMEHPALFSGTPSRFAVHLPLHQERLCNSTC